MIRKVNLAMGDELEERKKDFLSFFKHKKEDSELEGEIVKENKFLKKNYVIWGVFLIITWIGYFIRTRNLELLKDITTGKYIPLALDPHVFLRYVKHISEYGELMSVDPMRYYPWGYTNMVEFKLLSYLIAYLYKFLNFFDSALTIEKIHVMYPAIAFIFGLLFFFLLVKKLFDYRVALLASGFLAVIPPYLYRTLSGFSDKEAMGMVFFFAALYFFITSWDSKNIKYNILFGALSGLLTGLMGLMWGGFTFVVASIGIFASINFIFLTYKKGNFYSYISWYVVYYLIMILFRGYRLNSLIGTYFAAVTSVAFVFVIFNYLMLKFKLKEKIEGKVKLPFKIVNFLVVLVLGFIVSLISFGGEFIAMQINQLYVTLTSPFGASRWSLTVAEAHQPYFKDWVNNTNWKYTLVLFSGLGILLWDMLRPFKKHIRKIFTTLYMLFLLGVFFSRYSPASGYLNGESFIATYMYFGSLIGGIVILLGVYFYSFYKNKESFNKILTLKKHYLFLFSWFFVMMIASRSASRLLFVFAPITTILVAYACIRIFDYSLKSKDVYKIGLWILLFLILINPFALVGGFAGGLFEKGNLVSFYETSSAQGKYTGPSYNQQWQRAGGWVRENTPEDAVFAHWWDYGYWVQANFNRATMTDGGNAKDSLNHLMGRYVLTGVNETGALKFLKAHNATNLLMISDEIGKYPAFSSIGSDVNWDRYSWLQMFSLDEQRTQETQDTVIKTYTGVSPLDWNLKYQGNLYPKGQAAVVGFFVPTDKQSGELLQPVGILDFGGSQIQIPLKCVFIDNKKIEFESDGLNGCLRMIPYINPDGSGEANRMGIYLSEKVSKSLFSKLYMFNEEGKYFKLVYGDEDMPLAYFNGRVIGPLKIWEISYPKDLDVPEIYYDDELPDPRVNNIEGRY